MLWIGNYPSFPRPTPEFSGSCVLNSSCAVPLILSLMDGEASSVAEFEKVLCEFDMQDSTGHAQDPLPETKTSAFPKKTSTDLSDFTRISASGLGDVLETEAVAGLPADSDSVSASEMGSVVPSIACSLSSPLDPHLAPDSAPVDVSETLGTEGVYAGCSDVHLCDSDEPYMIPDADWVTTGGTDLLILS